MVTIIDYGMGNVRSVQKAFELFYPKVRVSSSPKHIFDSDKIVLPGVGAFGKAMQELKKRDLIEPIAETIERGSPFLGICLGLQLLFSQSEEGGKIKGLDILKGRVRRFSSRNGLKIPHMGWNKISAKRIPRLRPSTSSGPRSGQETQSTKLLTGVADGSYMYFVHSYYVQPQDEDIILCETEYGVNFASGIHKDNIYGFQFHPEKSQSRGLQIIKNFVELT